MADVRTLLGFDFGEVRIGVAVGNTLTESAQALTVLASVPTRERFERIARLIAEWQPAALVVGRPVHPDGNPHDMTLRCERFARQLSGRFNLPVHLTDERYSSAIAQSEGAGAGQLDAQAAAIILRQYLSEAGAPPAPIPSLPDPSAP
ncbi:MAG: Holliday junction resolvase RuvX [Burkholderiaceae bacterium]|nr:Holliday junction resolvase RuvX [Burkholderiaceae bacterium]